MSKTVHFKHPVDGYAYCWPGTGENAHKNAQLTSDEYEVTCKACLRESAWRPVPGFPNYEINRNGNVRNFWTGHILKIQVSERGSIQVKLYDAPNKICVSRSVRRLLKDAFGVTMSKDELLVSLSEGIK